ncbi:hypothetical protein ACU8KH_06141 [Lachancea thermotolerans]
MLDFIGKKAKAIQLLPAVVIYGYFLLHHEVLPTKTSRIHIILEQSNQTCKDNFKA